MLRKELQKIQYWSKNKTNFFIYYVNTYVYWFKKFVIWEWWYFKRREKLPGRAQLGILILCFSVSLSLSQMILCRCIQSLKKFWLLGQQRNLKARQIVEILDYLYYFLVIFLADDSLSCKVLTFKIKYLEFQITLIDYLFHY
jgi:hypothetical protein